MISIEVNNVSQLQEAFSRAPQIVEPILQRAIEGTGAILARHTLKDNPVPWRTGNLLQSFRFASSRLMATWRPTAKYAEAVEYGTGIYGTTGSPITPRNGKVLSWIGGGTGGKYVTSASGKRYYKSGTKGDRVYVRSIKGMKPHPYMRIIAENATPDINRFMISAMSQITQAFALNKI